MGGFTQSIVQGLTEVSTTDKQGLGTIYNRGSEVFKYIEYDAGAAPIDGDAGNICYYDATLGHENSLVTCDISDADTVPICAGQIMADLLDGEFGWIRVRGLSDPLAIDVAAGAAGQKMTGTGAANGTLDLAVLVTDMVAGTMLDATASSQKVALDCPVF